jgi:putative ABC transport system permease protein
VSQRLESIVQDVRYGARVLRKNRGFTAIAVLVLALGIGLNATIVSVFAHVLLTPLRFDRSDDLYVVTSHAASLGDARRMASGPDFRDYRDQASAFVSVAAAVPHFAEVWTGDGEPRIVTCASPTIDFFRTMGIRPVLGRVFVPDEFHDLANSTLIVSWRFWREQLGADPHVIGRTIRIEGVASTIVGVLPPMPDLYSDVDVWLKLVTEPSWDFMNWRQNKFLDVIVRLKPGVTRSVAEQQATAILRRATGEPPDVQARLVPLKDFIVGPVAPQLDLMLAAVSLVLLVTCLNTAALLLSRSVKRAPELALRLGLGGSLGRIRQQLLVEGLVLSAAGGAFGIFLAWIAVGSVRAIPGLSLPRLEGLHLNVPALLFSVAIVLLTSVAFTLLPARMLATLDVASGFRGSRTETGRAHRRPFSALIVAEIACALVLTVCAGLLLRSFIRVQSVDLGFEPRHVLTAYLRTNYDDPSGFVFWREILTTAARLPGATSAALSDCLPTGKANEATLLFADRPVDNLHPPSTEACWISPDYFRALGVRLVHGRFFSDHDTLNAPPAVIINEEAVRRLFPGADPLGKRVAVSYLSLGSRTSGPPRMREVVGVVSNLRQRALDTPPAPAVYLPYTQDETFHVLNSMELYVRASVDDPGALAQSLRTSIQSRYPDQPVERTQVLQQVVERSVASRTYSVVLMTGFAAVALLLCGLGTYGVVSYVTEQRTREFGIRLALGATRRVVIVNVLQQGGVLVAAGAACGLLLSFAATRTLSRLLFETTPFDPQVFAAAVVLFATIGVLACLVPAIRASRLEPRTALNTE